MKRKLMLLMTCLFIGIGLVNAQVSKVTGTVTSHEDGLPVVGASVLVKGTTVGTVTDIDGNFTITNVPSSAGTLVVSFIGMKTQEVAVKPVVKVVLHSNAEMLDEVMVVAFGTAKKSAFTGSAAIVDSKELSKRITTNVTDALVGSVAGLQMRGSSGAPGSSSGSVNIRGISSLYAATDPLVIVDGAPYTSSLSNIPQSDIESVSVLKDAASAALYGARGAAGVIIITTKKGNSQKAEVKLDMKWGVNSRAIQDYDVITDPGEYYEAYYSQLYNRYFYGNGYDAKTANMKANSQMLDDLKYNVYTLPEGELLIGENGKLNPNATLGRKYSIDGMDYYLTPDNWTDALYRNALRQEYNVSINGGNNTSSFYASMGYLDEDGIIVNSDYQRISGRVKADFQAKKWLKIGTNISYIHSNQNATPGLSTASDSGSVMYYSSMIAPIYPMYVRKYDSQGNIVINTDEQGRPMYDFGNGSSSYGLGRPFLSPGNPLANLQYDQLLTTGDQLNGSFVADINITNFLKANITSTVIWGQTNVSNFENPFYGSKSGVNGRLTKESTTALRTNNIQTLTYFQNFDKHYVNVMIGHEYYNTSSKYLGAIAEGAFSPEITEIDAYANNKVKSSSNRSRYNVEGFFGNLQYNYDEKYYATASYRRDASSAFAKAHQWGNFWSVGGAWIISKEKFMEETSSWLDMLKLKFSVGQQGNDNIGSYSYTNLYQLVPVDLTSMSASFAQMGNGNITWETTTNYNLGVEFSLWNGRLSGNVDIYNKKTSDLLFWLSVPEAAGTRGYYGNIGDIRNRGIEMVLSGSIIRNRNFEWIVSGNFSHNTTKILSLPETKTAGLGGFLETNSTGYGQTWFEVGKPLYNATCIEYAGVNEHGEALYWVDDELNGATNRPGKNHTSTTTNPNQATLYTQGSVLPKLFGGFNTSLRIGDFDLSASFDYQIGGKLYDFRYASMMSPCENAGSAGSAIHKDYAKAWSPNNTSSDIPRWQYGDQYSVFSTSDRFLTNASYLNFQSFTVGYNVPKTLLKNVANLRVYVAGENLFFWSARKGFDPRNSFDGNTTVPTYSPARNITGGIQLTF